MPTTKCIWPGCNYYATQIVENSVMCAEHYYAYYEEDRLSDLKVLDGGADGAEDESELTTTIGAAFSVDSPQDALEFYIALEELAAQMGATLNSLNVFASGPQPQQPAFF
jgi:hypothetical protein